ncbi:hypothetical protein GWK47_006093 [Chionoecetes opilio]|uniref:Uncharacterized protein n=1 Tax=Chionoecetes opilio TaxID=41210 RepID=A0A8J4YFM1_CHIOP|nr:hypothetical protein GWK47_006093 [Chionoecetes opilio]
MSPADSLASTFSVTQSVAHLRTVLSIPFVGCLGNLQCQLAYAPEETDRLGLTVEACGQAADRVCTVEYRYLDCCPEADSALLAGSNNFLLNFKRISVPTEHCVLLKVASTPSPSLQSVHVEFQWHVPKSLETGGGSLSMMHSHYTRFHAASRSNPPPAFQPLTHTRPFTPFTCTATCNSNQNVGIG